MDFMWRPVAVLVAFICAFQWKSVMGGLHVLPPADALTWMFYVAIEDIRFFSHGGVDLQGTMRAALTNLGKGQTTQGGSTLTQQYVKNVLVAAGDKSATSDSLARKVREARYAIALERRLTKSQILERYLNIVYFGEGAYGVESAAHRYFAASPPSSSARSVPRLWQRCRRC